jgi:hypothetical protein
MPQHFVEARDRGENEANTVLHVVKFLEVVLGYDSLKGEISKEFPIKDKFCDLALKIDGTVHILMECKAASFQGLKDKHIEQAENYAANAGIQWVALSNGIEWRLYHLSFAENEGIRHDLAFEANLLDEIESNAESLWAKLSLLSRHSVQKDLLKDFWTQKKALSPASVVRTLFSQKVLVVMRRELKKRSEARPDLEDVFNAIRDVLSKEALLEAGDIGMPKIHKSLSRARKQKLREAGRKAAETRRESEQSSLADIVKAGLLPAPVGLFRRYKGQMIEATLLPDGQIEFRGKSYANCSTVAEVARATVAGRRISTNGWKFWRFLDPKGNKCTLASIRSAFLASKQGA